MHNIQGFTSESPLVDKHHRARCPNCKRFVTFNGYINMKDESWHIWECKYCGAFNEHFHKEYGESSSQYYNSAKECYCGERS